MPFDYGGRFNDDEHIFPVRRKRRERDPEQPGGVRDFRLLFLLVIRSELLPQREVFDCKITDALFGPEQGNSE